MSTTINWLGRAGLVLAGWLLILLAMPFIGPSGRQVAVVGDTAQAIRTITEAGGEVVEIRKGAVLATSDKPGFTAALYHHGARLVLEGRIGAGCFGPR